MNVTAEVRELGVGYYAFSRSKEERAAEMKRLQDMREETERNKLKMKQRKEKERVSRLLNVVVR